MLRPDGTAGANDIGVGPGNGGAFGPNALPGGGAFGPNAAGGGAYRIGAGVSAPVPIARVEPVYTDEARQAKLQGSVLLQVVIDENGVPQNIFVVRALGLGLDQKAIEAVQQWRFKPSFLNGRPVSVSATIEVNFRPL
jgi:TonB family protein